MAKRTNTERVLIAIVIILVALIIILSVRTYTQYQTFRSHRHYIAQPNASIQSWMTIRTVERRYNVTNQTMESALNVTLTTAIQKKTLAAVCATQHLDCAVVVGRLNARQTT
jgi:heme/copper-type cytochrome/quinol oxidase subunit 2